VTSCETSRVDHLPEEEYREKNFPHEGFEFVQTDLFEGDVRVTPCEAFPNCVEGDSQSSCRT